MKIRSVRKLLPGDQIETQIIESTSLLTPDSITLVFSFLYGTFSDSVPD
jgi:hypothetical protein